MSFSPSSQVLALLQKERLSESDELAHGELGDETESLLDRFHGPGRVRGFKPATPVGTSCNGSDWLGELVARISQRLVLDQNRTPVEGRTNPQHTRLSNEGGASESLS